MLGATADERALHARLLAGDLTAPAELATRYLPDLVRVLKNRHADVAARDESIVLDAATDALLGYALSPSDFDPDRRRLTGYLYMSADGDLRNALAKAWKEARREIVFSPVELLDLDRNTEDTNPGARNLDEQVLWARICTVVPDPLEQRVVALMIDGTRETEAYAVVLGLSDRPPSEQARDVKRVKDKLRARLRRAGWDRFLEDLNGRTL